MHDLCALTYCFHVSLSMFSEVLKGRRKAKLEHHLQSLLASSCCFGLKEQAHEGGLSGGIGIPRKGVVYSSAEIILDVFGSHEVASGNDDGRRMKNQRNIFMFINCGMGVIMVYFSETATTQ